MESGQERRERKPHVEAVCAEFGHVASEREMELLANVLQSGEQVLAVASGIVPLDLNQLDKKGVGIAVSTDRRVLFLRHGKSDAPVSIDLQHDAIQSATRKAGESLAEIEFRFHGGNSVTVTDAVPNWAASRLADAVNGATGSADVARDSETSVSKPAADTGQRDTQSRGAARRQSVKPANRAGSAPKKKRGCFATGLIVIGVIFGLLVVLLVAVGIFVELPDEDSPEPTAVRRLPTVARIQLTDELRGRVGEMWATVEIQKSVGPPIAEILCIEWDASEEFWNRVEQRARDLLSWKFDPSCPLDVSYHASGGAARERVWEIMEGARGNREVIKEIEESLNELEETMCLTKRGDYKVRADRVIEWLRVHERRGSFAPC